MISCNYVSFGQLKDIGDSEYKTQTRGWGGETKTKTQPPSNVTELCHLISKLPQVPVAALKAPLDLLASQQSVNFIIQNN